MHEEGCSMIMYCQNQQCDFEYDATPFNAPLQFCPKCYGGWFGNVKDVASFGIPCPDTFHRTDILTPKFFSSLNRGNS